MAISYLDYKKTYGEQINNYYKKASEELNATNYKNREKELKEIEAKKNKWYNNFFKKSEAYNNAFSNFDNGYDFGDVTKSSLKTLGATTKTVGASALDLGLNAVEGVANVGTGAAKLISGGIAQVADWVGKDEYANKVRNNIATKENPITAALNKAESKIDKNSIFGRTSDEVASLIGYTGGLAAGGAALGGAGNIPISIAGKTLNVPTLAAISGAGEGLTESYSKKNVSDAQAWTKALGSGAIEGITEGLFGMFGVGGSEITDQWGKQAASLFKSGIAKTLAKTGVSATGEAVEEFLSYLGNQGLDKIIDLFSNENSAKFHDKWDWENVGEQMALAFLSAGLTQGGSTIVQAQIISNNAIREAEEDLDRKLTDAEKQSILDQVIDSLIKGENTNDKDNQQEVDLNSIEAEMTALQEQKSKTTDANEISQIEAQINTLQQQLDTLNQNMSTLVENSQNEPNTTKSNRINDEQIKNLADSVKARNISINTPEYKFAKALETKLGIKIAFKNNVKTPRGESVNGFYNPFTKTIELNTRSGQTVQRLLTHELTHALEGTAQMRQLQDFVISYFGARNENLWQSAYSNLASLYFPVYGNRTDFNEKVQSEATAEILGNLINDQEFLNRLAKNKPNVFLKLYARVNELIARVTGNEKAFLNAVKAKMEIAWKEAQQTNNENNYVGEETPAYSKNNIPIDNKLLNKYKNVKDIFNNEFDNYDGNIDLKNEISEIENSNLSNLKISDLKQLANTIFSKYNSTNNFVNNGNEIVVTKSGINESIEKIYNNRRQRNLLKEHLQVFSDLGDIIEHAKLSNQASNIKNNPDITHWNYYIDGLNILGESYKLVFDVRSMKDGQNQYRVQRLERNIQKTGNYDGDTKSALPPYSQPVSTKNDTIKLPKSQNKVSNTNNTQNKKSYSLPLVREIQGMKTTKSEVEDAVYNKFEQMMDEYGFDVDDIQGVYLHGSRLRGTAKADSDLDAVVFYIGNENEDGIFNTINNENNQLVIDGVKVDINPVSIDSLSEIDDYIARSEKYDQEIKNKKTSYSLPLAKQLEKQGEKIMQKSIDYVNYFENYLEEEGITNPTEQDIYNSYDSYDAYDAEGSFNSDEEQAYIRTIKDYLKDRDTSYSLPTELKEDNQGRKLSKEQQEYFKDSKVRDDAGNLMVVYHTMTNEGKQFNEFNPVGTEHYRFGDQVVNYYTDDKEMSGSYANQRYEMADTKRITSMKQVEDYINKMNKNGWGSYRKYELIRDNGKYVLIDNSEVPNSNQTWQEVYDEANEYKKTLTAEELAQFKDMFDNEVRQGRAYDIDSYLKRKGYEFGSKQDEIAQKYLQIDNKSYPEAGIYFDVLMRDAKYHTIETFENEQDLYRRLKSAYDHIDRYQYEGYVNITNPYVVDADGENWNSVSYKYDEEAIDKYINLDESIKEKLINLVRESNSKYNIARDRYNELRDTMENHLTKRQETLLDVFQNYTTEAGYTKIRDDERQDIAKLHGIDDDIESLRKEFNSDTNFLIKFGNTTLKQFARYYNEVMLDHLKYDSVTKYFFNEAPKILEGTGISANNDTWYIAGQDFKEDDIRENFETKQTTNDIVKEVLQMNSDGANYDGIIIKNVIDYGGYKHETTKPNDIYITFNSNQFKALDNKKPTNDADIRYSVVNDGAFEQFLEEEVRPINPNKQESSFEDIRRRVLNPLQISKLTKEDANTTPNLPDITRNKNNDGKSKFAKNIENKVGMLSQESKDLLLEDDDVRFYDKVTNEESLEEAFERLNKNGKSETINWFSKDSKNANSTDVAEGWILLKQYQDAANNATNEIDRNEANRSMVEVAKRLRDIGTKAGQTVQAFNILNRLTPEGMVYYAQSELDEAYNQMVKNKSKEWIDSNRDRFQLTPDEVQFIMDTMQEISTMEDGYDKRVKLAEIQKLMTDKLPPEKGARIKSWMRMSMLFNPKTQVRNVVGNALIAPINSFGDLFASYADKLISRKTGVRTTGTTNVKALLDGFKRGAYEATNDYRKGINTRDMEGNRFEIGEGKSFSDKTIIGRTLNRTESLLNYVMDAGDRVFSEAAFENSIKNQMKLNNTDEITQDMIDIAHQEALSRTWNDNNEYTKFVLTTRSMLNKIKIGGYGLGDVLIPFAKTPANLTKAIVDYSPVGMINAIKEGNNLRKSLSNGQYTAQMQHKFVQDLGKAVAGTALYILGYALAKAKISTGKSDDDKDVANFLKNTLGISSYSIKIGNKSFTYDWAQPIAAPLAITSNILSSKNNKTALLEGITSSLNSAGSILLEQSFLQSLNDVLTDNDGIFSGLETEILELPARAIPTFVKQIADMTDGTQRQTYEYKQPVKSAINYAKSKLPGVSKTLAPKVDTMGREIQKYGGNNNIFNVFLNPANVNTQNISTAAKEIYDVYKKTGDSTIMPRVAPYYVGNGDDRVVFTPEQVASFQKTSGEIIEKSVSKLANNSSYKKLSYEDKAAVLNDIVNYSYNVAKSKVLNTDISSDYAKANDYIKAGGNIGDYYIYRNATSGLSADKDKNGKSISGSKKKKVINYINTMNISVKLKLYLIEQNGYSTKGYRVVNGRIVL